MNPSKLSRERLYFYCSLKFIYRTLNEINSSIEINTIYTVPMTVDGGRRILMKENYKSRIYEINTIDAKCIVKLRELRNRSVKFLCKASELNRQHFR